MRCKYCHNVDTWNPESKDLQTADELLDKAERFRTYWGKEGGITVSGGEALLQLEIIDKNSMPKKGSGIQSPIPYCIT